MLLDKLRDFARQELRRIAMSANQAQFSGCAGLPSSWVHAPCRAADNRFRARTGDQDERRVSPRRIKRGRD
jgi:hypothetical protein